MASVSALKAVAPAKPSAPASGPLAIATARPAPASSPDASDGSPQPPKFDAALQSARQDRRPASAAKKEDSTPSPTDDQAHNTPENAADAADSQSEAPVAKDGSPQEHSEDGGGAAPKQKEAPDQDQAKCESPVSPEQPVVVSSQMIVPPTFQADVKAEVPEQHSSDVTNAGGKAEAPQVTADQQNPPVAPKVQPAHVVAGQKPPIPKLTVDPQTGEPINTPYNSQEHAAPTPPVPPQQIAKPVTAPPPQASADDSPTPGNAPPPPAAPVNEAKPVVPAPQSSSALAERLTQVRAAHVEVQSQRSVPRPGVASQPADANQLQQAAGTPSSADAQEKAAIDLAPLHDAAIQTAQPQTSPLTVTPLPIASASSHVENAGTASTAQESPHAQAADPLDQVVLGLRGKLDARTGKAEIRLDPPNLGAVRVSLTLNDGALTAEFHSSSALVRDLLKGNLDKLKAVLESQGVAVDRLAVDAPPSADSSSARGHGDQSGSFGSAAHDGRSAGQYSQDSRGRRPAEVPDFDRVSRQTREAPLDLVA